LSDGGTTAVIASSGTVTLLKVARAMRWNVSIPYLCGKTIQHRMPGNAIPRLEGLRAWGVVQNPCFLRYTDELIRPAFSCRINMEYESI
jgi:hypothetical protein